MAVGATTESASAAPGSKSLTIQYSAKVIKNEQFTLSGQLTTRFERPVKLQVKKDGSWVTSGSPATADATTGRFTFTRSTSVSRYYRFVAPTAPDSGGDPKKIVGDAKKVTIVSQKVVTATLVGQTACNNSSDPADKVTAYAKFYPARPGRTVNLTTTASLSSLATQQGGEGEVAITFAPGETNGTYQALLTAAERSGAAAISSAPKTFSVITCFFIPP